MLGPWLHADADTRARDHHETLYAILTRAFIGAIIGARLFYVLRHLADYLQHPLDIIAVQKGGLTLLGGIAGAVIAVWGAILGLWV